MGGFDFDDKGLPLLRGIRDRDGHMRIMSFTTRQPTGPYEYVVQDFIKDRETLENVFGKSESFMKGLRDMSADTAIDDDLRQQAADLLFYIEADVEALSAQAIQGTDMADARRFANLQRRYAGLALSNEELRTGRLMGTRESQLLRYDEDYFVEGQRSAERVISGVYERVYGQNIKELSAPMQAALAQSGGSGTLALTPQLMQSMSAAEREEFLPAYVEGQFFKMILDKRPMPLSEQERRGIIDSIQQVGGANPAQVLELINQASAPDDTEFREALGEILQHATNTNDDALVAKISGALQGYVSRVQIPEQKEIIGQYINRLMSVASTVEQKRAITDRLQELSQGGDANATALLGALNNLYNGFIPPSDAVDAAVNAGGTIVRSGEDYIQGLNSALLAANAQEIEPERITEFLSQLISDTRRGHKNRLGWKNSSDHWRQQARS